MKNKVQNMTSFTPRVELQDELRASAKILLERFDNIEQIFDDNLLTALPKDGYHGIAQILMPDHKNPSRVFEKLASVLYMSAYKSETQASGASKVALLHGLHTVLGPKNLGMPKTPAERADRTQQEDGWQAFLDTLETCSTPTTNKSLESLLMTSRAVLALDKNLPTIALEAAALAGLEGKILIESQKRGQQNWFLEYKVGHHFNLKPFNWMLSPRTKTYQADLAKVLLFDGVMEKVSEIEHLLLAASENNQPLMIVASAFSEEIVATCKTNNDRGVFNVMPIRLHSDLESINTVVDLAVILGTTPITVQHNTLLSMVKWEELPVAKKILVDAQGVTTVIPNDTSDKSKYSLGIHVRDLIHRRHSDTTMDDIKSLIDKRLRSLLSHQVVLHMPDVPLAKEEAYRAVLDVLLRDIKVLLNYGEVELQKLLDKTNNAVIKSTLRALMDLGHSHMPTMSLALGVMMAEKNIKPMLEAAGFVC